MAYSNRVRKIGSKSLGESGVYIFEIPRKDFLRNLFLYLSGNLVIGTLGSPVSRALVPFNFIKRIELIADGRDTIKSIPGWALAMKNYFHFGQLGYSTTDTWAADATNAFKGVLTLPLVMPGMMKDMDFFFDTSVYSTLELRITTDSFSNGLFSTAPTAITSGTVSLDVYAEEVVQLSKNVRLMPSIYKENYLEQTATATAGNQQMILPTKTLIKGIMFETATSGEGAGSILNEVTVQSGTTVFGKIASLPLQYLYPSHRGHHDLTKITGFYYLDFNPEGRLVDCLNALNLPSLEAIFDITGVASSVIRAYPDEFIVPRKAV